MTHVVSWLRQNHRAIRFLVVVIMVTGLPLANAQTEEHVHIYMQGGTRTCEAPGSPDTPVPGATRTVVFCVHNAVHAPVSGAPVSWSISSTDGNAGFVGTPEPFTAGTGATAGEARAVVQRTTAGSALIRGTWATTGKSASISITWADAPPPTHHVHLLKSPPGTIGNACHTTTEGGNATAAGTGEERTASSETQTVVACVHDVNHAVVPGRPVFLDTINFGSASSPPTATATSDGQGLATFMVGSPTAGKTETTAKADGKVSNTYRVTWRRAVDHVHVFLEGQGTCESPPPTARVAVGVTATVIACVHGPDHDGIPDSGAVPSTGAGDFDVDVAWSYVGNAGDLVGTQEVETDVNGLARAKIRSSTTVGTARVTASASTESPVAATRSGGLNVEYLKINVSLTPTADTNTIGTTHTVTATVVDGEGDPVSGTSVDFVAAGTGRESPASGQRTTNSNGQAGFSFTSTGTGISTITATVSALSANASKTWVCAPFGGAYFPNFDIARDIALIPGESCKGYVLDGFGARHPFGGAPPTTAGAYFAGHDIARALVLKSDGTGGFVLDGFGAIHPFDIGSPTTPTAKPIGGPYFPGFDIARDILLVSASSGYILDGYGARHPFGGAAATTGGPYFAGNDIANAFVMLAGQGSEGHVLDGLGARHPFNGANQTTGGPYFPGNDIARDIVLTGAGRGFVLDGFGARHPFGGQAATVEGPYFLGFDIARRLVLAPSLKAGIVVDGFGGLHQFFVP